MRQAVNEALNDSLPMTLAYVDGSGVPHLSLRGSVHVHGDHELAIWVRDPEGGFLQALGEHPSVVLWYRNPATRATYLFTGQARVVTDAAATRAVYDATPERERNVDPRATRQGRRRRPGADRRRRPRGARLHGTPGLSGSPGGAPVCR